MDLVAVPDYQTLSREAARIVANRIRRRPDLTLGLPTGKTPVGMYAELVRLHRENALDFSRVRTFNLDEYIGLPPGHPRSYHAYMQRHLFDYVNIRPENAHIPNGAPGTNLDAECRNYEAAIRNAGGIDLLVAGIGGNGHIAFNEPGSPFDSRTRVVSLTRETIAAASPHFDGIENVPRTAITTGIQTLLDAREILLLVHGENKREALRRAVTGEITEQCPASALRRHPAVTALSDLSGNE